MALQANTVDLDEVARFSAIADEWWDKSGKFKPLHIINPLRIGYIKERAGSLAGKTLLDIGCGGGLIAEPMAEAGAIVTAIDASEKNIAVAKLHAERSKLFIDYRATTAEALVQTGTQFDIVLALEIIEHVADVAAFIEASVRLLKPGGTLVMSTLNRTAKSYALAIVGAEYVLRWLPRGTHTWSKFLKPAELARQLRQQNIDVTDTTGMVMDPISWKWRLEKHDLDVNYLMSGTKTG